MSDTTTHIDDATIKAAIEQHDDPSHEDALDIPEVRTHLAELQRDLTEYWAEYMDSIEDGDVELVADNGDVVVLADLTEHAWSEHHTALGVDDDVTRRVLESVHHRVAERLSDYDWSIVTPLVIHRPDDADSERRYIEAAVNGLMHRGLSPGQAWAYYGVEIRGHSRNQWAARCGYNDHSAVSEPLRKAEEKLP